MNDCSRAIAREQSRIDLSRVRKLYFSLRMPIPQQHHTQHSSLLSVYRYRAEYCICIPTFSSVRSLIFKNLSHSINKKTLPNQSKSILVRLLFYIDLIFSSTFQYYIKIAFIKINKNASIAELCFFSNKCQGISIFHFLHSNNAITE